MKEKFQKHRHLMFFAQVKYELVAGAKLAGIGTLLAHELALVHPHVFLRLRQVGEVGVIIIEPADVVLMSSL